MHDLKADIIILSYFVVEWLEKILEYVEGQLKKSFNSVLKRYQLLGTNVNITQTGHVSLHFYQEHNPFYNIRCSLFMGFLVEKTAYDYPPLAG